MIIDKQKLATLLFEGLDDCVLGDDNDSTPMSIDDLLTPKQKYYLVYNIIHLLPKTDHEKVIEFNETFGVAKEESCDIKDFKYGNLRFRLLLEEVIELGFALGIAQGEIYNTFIELQAKVRDSNIKPSLTEVADALTDINYVSYGALNVFNLDSVTYELMEEVHNSNMSKLLPKNIREKDLIDIVEEFNVKSIAVRTERTKKGLVIRNAATGKVLKPSTYKPANLKKIIDKLTTKLKKDGESDN